MNTLKSSGNIKILSFVMVLIFAFLFGGVGLTAYAAQSSLPGDALYSFKNGLEKMQQNLASDDQKAELELALAGNRLDEIVLLIKEGRFDKVMRTSREFERHIQLALEAVKQLADDDPSRAAELTKLLAEQISQYSEALTSALSELPKDVRESLREAVNRTDKVLEPISDFKIDDDGNNQNDNSSDDTFDGNFNQNSNENETEDNSNGSLDNNTNENINDNINSNEDSISNNNENMNDNDNDRNDTVIKGVVEKIEPGIWVVDGIRIEVDSSTIIEGEIEVFDRVEVKVVQNGSGDMPIAIKIELQNTEDSTNSKYVNDSSKINNTANENINSSIENENENTNSSVDDENDDNSNDNDNHQENENDHPENENENSNDD